MTMKTVPKLCDIKVKYMTFSVLALVLLVVILYFVILPQDVSYLDAVSDKTDFLRKKKNHKITRIKDGNVENLMKHLGVSEFKEILKPLMRERVPGTEGSIVVQNYIKKEMVQLGWHVWEDKFEELTPLGNKEFTNIITTHNMNAQRRITLACHFDSKYFKNIEFIGATDSAVPCAMLIDLAKSLQPLLKTSDSQVKDVTLQFVFFDGEEAFVQWTDKDSLYGARHLAQLLGNRQISIGENLQVSELQAMDVLILLDLLGAPDPRFSNWFPKKTGDLFKALQETEKYLAERGYLEPADQFQGKKSSTYFIGKAVYGGGIQDDHIPFLNRGVRVVHMISYPFPSVWHTEKDNESALDYDTIGNLNKILRLFVARYLHL